MNRSCYQTRPAARGADFRGWVHITIHLFPLAVRRAEDA